MWYWEFGELCLELWTLSVNDLPIHGNNSYCTREKDQRWTSSQLVVLHPCHIIIENNCSPKWWKCRKSQERGSRQRQWGRQPQLCVFSSTAMHHIRHIHFHAVSWLSAIQCYIFYSNTNPTLQAPVIVFLILLSLADWNQEEKIINNHANNALEDV